MNKKKQPQKKSSTQVQKKQVQNADEIPIEVAEVIKDLPKEKQKTLIRAFALREHYSVPLP